MEDKNRTPSPVLLLIVSGLYLGLTLILRFTRDDIIIQQGIRFYRTLNAAVLIVGGFCTAALLVHFLLNWNKQQKRKRAQDEETAKQQAALEEEVILSS